MIRRLERVLVLVFALALSGAIGCATFLGTHPFSSMPKPDFGKREKFNPGNALQFWVSVTPQTIADATTENAYGQRVPAKWVTVFILFRHPYEPWRGAHPVLTVTSGQRFRFPKAADHSWALQGPFGVGGHELKVEIVKDDVVLYTQSLAFTVFPPQPKGDL